MLAIVVLPKITYTKTYQRKLEIIISTSVLRRKISSIVTQSHLSEKFIISIDLFFGGSKQFIHYQKLFINSTLI